MDYEKKYKETLAKARHYYLTGKGEPVDFIKMIFPELAESEEEKNIKNLIDELKCSLKVTKWQNESNGGEEKRIALLEWAIAWLEKQGDNMCISEATKQELEDNLNKALEKETSESWNKFLEEQGEQKHTPKHNVGDTIYYNSFGKVKSMIVANVVTDSTDNPMYEDKEGNAVLEKDLIEQKPADKVEPKFKVGDWVVVDGVTQQVTQIRPNGFDTDMAWNGKLTFKDVHLWTIADAKDGDVLAYVTDEEDLWIMIYWSLYEPYDGHVHYHALLVNDNFADKGTCCICIDNLKPATKEQRDLLFQKMKEACYEWDADKKELRKVEHTTWSEEDETMFVNLVAFLEGLCGTPEGGTKTYAEWLKERYKYALPMPHWKPSKSQMKALEFAIEVLGDSEYAMNKRILEKLFVQLKNLTK